jgi:acetylornithine deacetylase/succinyl-diaminopimelate desuccinylase family protein
MASRSDLRVMVQQRREQCVGFLRDALRLQSVAPNEAAIGALIAERLSSSRAEVRVVEAEPRRPNVLANACGTGTGPVLLVNDHMDTVPAGPRDEWSVDPFGAVVKDGWIYGRGAVDSKSGLCSMVMATEIFLAAGGPARGELLMTAVCDEEVGSRLGTRYLLQQGLIRGDFGIVCEPTGNRIECAAKGVLHVEIMTKGRMAHGGKPWAGLNAISHMARVIDAMEGYGAKLAQRRHPLVGAPSVTIGTIQGGTVPNMVASECRLVVDRRILPGEDSAGAIAEISAIVAGLSAADPEFNASTRVLLDWPSVEVRPDSPVVVALSNALTEVLGAKPEIGGKDGGTDAAWIFKATGIPMIHFSPGVSKFVLAADERVEVDAYMSAIEALVLTFEEILGVAS